MVEQLLSYNQKANKVLPSKVVFYRDGKLVCEISPVLLNVFTQELMMVSSEKLLVMKSRLFVKLSMVSHREFSNIKFSYFIPAVYGEKSKHPQLTFLVVKKRHNTRFFACNHSGDDTKNMPIGTVIDTTIVHPYQNNF